MLETFKSSQPQSHAQILREEAVRRLSRSPHPYHRQHFELPHASERISTNVLPKSQSLPLAQNTTVAGQEESRSRSDRYRESTNSDSGTEADDEHFLKGLPAPKLRLHKGLRGRDGTVSSTPSPLLSPMILEDELQRTHSQLGRSTSASAGSLDADSRKILEAFRRRRRVEVGRRVTETAILGLVAVILCQRSEIMQILRLWRKEISCQILILLFLLSAYPFRILSHTRPLHWMQWPYVWTVPATFDPARLLYPPILTMMVSLLVCIGNPSALLPTIVLSISSLPQELVPNIGQSREAGNLQWLLSILPMSLPRVRSSGINAYGLGDVTINKEILTFLYPLHHALCVTIHALTITSLLPAELQLLSVALIELLLLASSPQAVILKALLWGGGIGVLVSCGRVLSWGVALARVPKWRFRRDAPLPRSRSRERRGTAHKLLFFPKLEASFFGGGGSVVSDSSDDDAHAFGGDLPQDFRNLGTETRIGGAPQTGDENTSMSALEPHWSAESTVQNGFVKFVRDISPLSRRRHTLPSVSSLTPKFADRTPSGRRKRSTSSSVQAFFSLTQAQATRRKWLYATFVYAWVLVIILVGIRGYVSRYALHGNEPIGWALGYLLGDWPHFRMEVVKANLTRWVCLPPRSSTASTESCRRGWVEHIRHSSIGDANTRLLLSVYWLCIIITGLAIVFRLSAIYEVDTRRKVFHFMMVAMLLPATYVDPTFAALALSLMLAIFLLLDLFRASQLPPLSKSLAYFLTPYVDGRDLKGPVVISHIFLLIGCAIPLWLSLGCLPRTGSNYLVGWEVPTREVSMVSGVICVGMGDAAASLIGRRYGRHKWVWGGGKSIEGSVAFALAVGLALVWAKVWLRFGGWQANNSDDFLVTLGKAGIASMLASLTEAVLTGGNDNVVVPVVLWVCVKGLDI